MSTELITYLLRDKEKPVVEIEVHLFEKCNLRCTFCCQEHDDDRATADNITSKIEIAKRYILTSPEYEFTINFMGGELYSDDISDELFSEYENFVYQLYDYGTSLHKRCEFTTVSNLIFQNPSRLKQLIENVRAKGIKLNLNTSFDFSGRGWNQIQKGIFKNNVEFFKDYINVVSVVLHKTSINTMVRERDPLFDYLYDNFQINFDHYVPDTRLSDILTPSDDDNLKAFRYIAKHYPKAHPISEWLNREYNSIQCCGMSRILISANNNVSTCRYLDYDQCKFETDIDRNNNANMIEKFFKEQGCLSCNYFNRCGFHCFVQADLKKRNKAQECFIKEFFDGELSGSRS